MKVLIVLLFLSQSVFAKTAIVKGRVESVTGCSDKVMVWVSLDKEEYKERLLLMHSEVPVGGTFQLHLLPGNYQLRASDKLGCETFKRIQVKEGEQNIPLKLEKK